MPFNPFGATLTFGDNGVFLLELLSGLGKGCFSLDETRSQLAAQAEIPILRKSFRLFKPGLFGTGAVLTAFERRGAMPCEAPAPVDVDLPPRIS